MISRTSTMAYTRAAPDAKTAALKAVELDPSLAEARTSLAGYYHRQEGRLDNAEREFRRALEINHPWPRGTPRPASTRRRSTCSSAPPPAAAA